MKKHRCKYSMFAVRIYNKKSISILFDIEKLSEKNGSHKDIHRSEIYNLECYL